MLFISREFDLKTNINPNVVTVKDVFLNKELCNGLSTGHWFWIITHFPRICHLCNKMFIISHVAKQCTHSELQNLTGDGVTKG